MSERKGTKGLELWCRKMTEGYPGVKVDNMTTSWRDGLAFCAIIHHFRPDLIEFDKLNKDDIYHNNELAFRVAEHSLGIPALLEPEDMVEYEVPDRLSILTYLSQFYQTFENQRGKSGARIAPKRPQSTPDHGIVSPASTSPPTKVQITIGRARREPCAKCGFPVFIAERLNVGKLLYHRTCFRCARCSSQLTLANYYETESGEFCCEICPDEERQISKKVSSEHVLSRSLSDEEKTASLQTYSEAPDAYSTHFETALEFPLDGDLKKSSTLTGSDSTEFTKARSHFFKTQMESSSESGSEDIPVELPKSKPPPLIKTQYEAEDIPFDRPKPKPPILVKPDTLRTDSVPHSDNSSFPSVKKDTDKLNSSVSEQTNDRFVTKDNASSSSRVSVRARMKLFENNEDNKSDVHTFSSSSNQVPLSSVKKATVVAIDDLEDFDNISRKDIDIENSSSEKNNSSTKLHSDEVGNESDIKVAIRDEKADISKETNIDLRQKDTFTSKADHLVETNLNITSPTSQLAASDHDMDTTPSNDSVIECPNSSQDASHITIDSETSEENHEKNQPSERNYIIIEDSPEVTNQHPETSKVLTISDDSFLTVNSSASAITVSSDDGVIPRRGYYTAYEVLSPQNNDENLENERSAIVHLSLAGSDLSKNASSMNESLIEKDPMPIEDENISTLNKSEEEQEVQNEIAVVINENVDENKEPENEVINGNVKESSSVEHREKSQENVSDAIVEVEGKITNTEQQEIPDKDAELKMQTTDSSSPTKESSENVIPDSEPIAAESDPNYPLDLNPFDDCDDSPSTSQKSFEVPDEEKVIASTRPVPAARPKKKIMPSLEEKEITGTPECLARIYVQRISRNPFEEDDDDDDEEKLESSNYNPFEEVEQEEQHVTMKPKKKIILSSEERKRMEAPVNWSAVSTDSPKSYNPFEDDGDEGDVEPPVKPVPVPTPRASKSNRPEPKPRDTLSLTSRGSHGGSNSSISSGSAFGSARKKKPAPRPPMPFRGNDSPGSSLASPSSSVTQSPNLSGTIRSRKTKRAPLPPNASTPAAYPERKNSDDTSTLSLGISPITFRSTDALPDDAHKEKNAKDEENRNMQSLIQSIGHQTDSNLPDKSTTGRWKRRKGQAPSRPIPERRIVKTLPISEIKRELDTIEIQQQGLEKQGVRLEQIIREKCEGTEEANAEDQVPIEVEDLILQLFELVNEKNELFRRQAELMYLRRQQRLEEEHADVEYQIRCLISQPEANKSDSDKVREETLIKRLVEIVERRNEIIECLEMDRRREAEEDNSISSQLNLYSAKRDGDKDSSKEEEKKDKKKKHKKLNKIIHTFKHKKEKDHKVDVDKDVDESEMNSSSEKGKKKKFNLF